jgi:hypothetical protein
MHASGAVADRPVDGDVLITSTAGSHLVSVVPYPHRLSFGNLTHAVQLARKWASTNGVMIWHAEDGHVAPLLPEDHTPMN